MSYEKPSEVTALAERFGWSWHEAKILGTRLVELREGKRLLGWISSRPHYCDRGHWQLNVEIGGLDYADGKPAYFMRLETAKQELVEFLAWRLHKVCAE